MSQVHKEQLTEIENALPNRSGLDVEIFGMEGVPEDVLKTHQQRVMTQFQQAEVERQAATGNPPAGGGAGGQPSKKPKLENMSEMKKRLAEHRAKRAEAAAGGSSGDATPIDAGQTPTTPATYQGQPQLVGAVPAPAQQPPSYPQPYAGAPVAAPYQQTASPGYQTYSPVSGHQIPGATAFPPAGYSPQPFPGHPSTPGYGATPPASFPPQQPTRTDSNTPPKPGGLPIPAGLPQRPAFGAPAVNPQQMQQMHMGHPIPPVPGASVPYTNGEPNTETSQVGSTTDGLIPGSANEPASKTTESTDKDKPSKKDRAKPTRMIYSHETVSPEERMAQLPRYAFDRAQFPDNKALGELPASTVTGVTRNENTVLDPAQ